MRVTAKGNWMWAQLREREVRGRVEGRSEEGEGSGGEGKQ